MSKDDITNLSEEKHQEKLYQIDLKIGFKVNVVQKNKQFTIIEICIRW